MTILVVPDGFKDSLTSQEVSDAICEGILAYDSGIKIHPVYASDGGDGFLKVVKIYKPDLEVVASKTVDPLGRAIEADYLWNDKTKTAYVELAAASGIELLAKQDRIVMQTSTMGTGLQIREAILKDAKIIYIGLGGSATNDAGMGIAAGLGYKFLDKDGVQVNTCGQNLGQVQQIIQPKSSDHFPMMYAINDVQNPLYGPNGAAHVYAKQKGGNPEEIEALDAGLRSIANIVSNELTINEAHLAGDGAAGGSAYGLRVFCGAQFKRGTEFVLGLTEFDALLATGKIDMLITGEGKIDDQTKNGKLVSGVIKRAKEYKVPVMAICGKLELDPVQTKLLGLQDVAQIYDSSKPEGYSYVHAKSLIAQKIKQLLACNS
ncbi:MAG: glycerate kinase [Gilvibacter sp.]